MTFESEKHLAEHVESLGGRLYLVGGAVRDKLLGLPVHDKDYVITGLAPERLPFEKIVGSNFPVFLVKIGGEKCEVAIARTEKKNGKDYHGFTFYCGPDVAIAQDLARRDLTINAMAEDVITGELLDPYNGWKDLLYERLRHVSDAFCDDPLRVYRVARFAAQIGFYVSRETFGIIKNLKEYLHALKPERVFQEFEKALMAKYPRRFFDCLLSAGLLDVHFPEVAALDVPDKHDGTAYRHVMNLLTYRNPFAPTKKFKMRLALLVHDFGKALTPREGWPAHHGHDKLGEQSVRDFCERLRIPNKARDFALLCTREHMRVKRLEDMKPGKVICLALTHRDEIFDLLEMSFVDSIYREGADEKKESDAYIQRNRIMRKALQAADEITGDMLLAEGYKRGPQLGEVLFQRRVERFKRLSE